MTIGQEIPYIGNRAYGLQFSGEGGKLALSLFRILAVVAIGVYLFLLTRRKTPPGPVFAISMILAGALGNIIDSVFYGVIFSKSTYHSVAVFLPEGGGYAGFLHGKVVDMFYFPLLVLQQSKLPQWLPDFLFGSDGYFVFFRPVFNVADAAITIGVLWLLLFERKFLKKL